MYNWEKEAAVITRRYMNADKSNIYGWFVELDKAMKKYFADGSIQNGSVYHAPLETGVTLEVLFYDKYTALNEITPKMQIRPLITKEQSFAGEIKQLSLYGRALEPINRGFGQMYPKDLEKILHSIVPGELIRFENGISYVCMGKDNNMLSLKEICGDITDNASLRKVLHQLK